MVTEPLPRRSILVPIDQYGVNRASLETLVRIARQLDRGLLGLLLEDSRLQQVADLPFTTEITLNGGGERSLLREQLIRHHSVVSSDTRRRLDELAQRDQVQLAFENAVGNRLHTVLERDGPLDIFLPARQRWQLQASSKPAPGKAIRQLAIVLSRTTQDNRVLDTTRLLQQAGLVKEIYVVSVGPPDRKQIDSLYCPGCKICVQANLSCDPATITRLIRQSAYDLLLLPRECLKGISPAVLENSLDRTGSQLLVIN